jgi:hypothetical protein
MESPIVAGSGTMLTEVIFMPVPPLIEPGPVARPRNRLGVGLPGHVKYPVPMVKSRMPFIEPLSIAVKSATAAVLPRTLVGDLKRPKQQLELKYVPRTTFPLYRTSVSFVAKNEPASFQKTNKVSQGPDGHDGDEVLNLICRTSPAFKVDAAAGVPPHKAAIKAVVSRSFLMVTAEYHTAIS